MTNSLFLSQQTVERDSSRAARVQDAISVKKPKGEVRVYAMIHYNVPFNALATFHIKIDYKMFLKTLQALWNFPKC